MLLLIVKLKDCIFTQLHFENNMSELKIAFRGEDAQLLCLDVLIDDRGERPGVMFADMELIGIPHRLVMSDRGLDSGTIEYRARCDSENQQLDLANIVQSCVRAVPHKYCTYNSETRNQRFYYTGNKS